MPAVFEPHTLVTDSRHNNRIAEQERKELQTEIIMTRNKRQRGASTLVQMDVSAHRRAEQQVLINIQQVSCRWSGEGHADGVVKGMRAVK